jgi:hypothetical protein
MGLGSWIRKKPIPDPGSRGKKRHRISDPDPQHWLLERQTVNAKAATALGSIPAFSGTVESERRQMKQC